MMTIPIGDLVVRRGESSSHFVVTEADSGREVAGPFEHLAHAASVADEIAKVRNVHAWVMHEGKVSRVR